MKKTTIIFLFTFLLLNKNQAQYYYKDILSTAQSKSEIESYKTAKINNVKINSIESNGENSPGFYCEKKISGDYKKTTLYTKSEGTSKSILISYYNNNFSLVKTYDSSEIVVSTNIYEYDNKNRLVKITTTSQSKDDDFENKLKEEHAYIYAEDKSLPERMYRIKNGRDTNMIVFSFDENNNISIEKDTRDASKYYYYYNIANKLSDIVHTNEYKQKLVADYIFEYNSQGRISQMTTNEDGSDNYLVWKYTYDNDLKIIERIFDRQGQMVGKLEYEYK